MPATPGDARCLAALCAALEASRGGEAPERLLAGFAEGLGAELAALLRLRDDGAAVRALGSRERRLAGPELLLRLPPGWVTALTEGQAASGTADELPPEARAGLRLAPGAALLLAPLTLAEGAGALLLAGGAAPWSGGQQLALRGLAAGLGGWQTARDLQQVLDHLPQRVAWKDRALRYRGVNRAFVRAAGLTSTQLLGRLDAELPLRAESGEHDIASAERELAALSGGPQLQQLERVALPGGRELWFNVSRVPVDGGLVIVREDISARVALGHQLHLARRMATLGELAAGVSADLRPLVAEILADLPAVRDDPRAQSRIGEVARRADELARQLLGFARRQLLEPVDVVPGQLLARMQPTLARLLGPAIALTFTPPSLRWVTRIDPRLLELLLVLLARDARQRLARGRVTLELGPATLGVERAREQALPAGEYLRLTLQAETDGPPGDDDDDDDGMSLALARTIAASAGGALRPGRGAGGALLRELHLPRVFSAPRTDEVEAGPVQDLLGVETLLLLEPDLDLRRALATVLRHLGYRVLATDRLALAVDLLVGTCPEAQVPERRVALALVPCALPGCGPELISRRLRERLPELRLLWLAPSAQAAGPAGDRLVVPCSFEALALRVRQALETRPA